MKLRNYINLMKNEEESIQYLVENNVIPPTCICYKCKRVMSIDYKKRHIDAQEERAGTQEVYLSILSLKMHTLE